jgi:hypothetical protein
MAHLVDKYQKDAPHYMALSVCQARLMKAGWWGSSWDWGITVNVHVLGFTCVLYTGNSKS